MKALDYVINLMDRSGDDADTGYQENLSMIVLIVFLALIMMMMVV